ncbi:MAG: hypothetical protein K2Y37_10175 [Pirellulales bacterium]|nr:hypothetical protein [Pirellulales bacterium]
MLAIKLCSCRLAEVAIGVAFAVWALHNGAAAAVDYRIEPLAAAADIDGLSDNITEQLAPTGIKIMRGNRTFCELWPAKSWAVKAGFSPSASVLYPFSVGELMGVVRYKLKATDFRGQEIAAGAYTLRYGLQPVDGNHAGTSPTRDFLLLLPTEKDTTAAAVEESSLFKLSAEVAGGTHPTMLLLMPFEGAADDLPQLAHDEANERWSVSFAGNGRSDGKAAKVPVNLVVVGQAAE